MHSHSIEHTAYQKALGSGRLRRSLLSQVWDMFCHAKL